MRRFSSYGPLDTDCHYFAPRKGLLHRAFTRLMGENPDKGGDYITVWAPRQCGKSWIMLEILNRFDNSGNFDAVKVDLEHLKTVSDISRVINSITKDISRQLGVKIPHLDNIEDFQEIFTRDFLSAPLVLILDEFDSLQNDIINQLVGIFRNIYNRRKIDLRKPRKDRWYQLHAVALVGVRSALGIENVKGSPFNVQRSLQVPNLDYEEVSGMFRWYEKESGRKVEVRAIQRLFEETGGQPGLIGWFGELLTEGFDGYRPDSTAPITSRDFEHIYTASTSDLPNTNILNIISKARQQPYNQTVLELFRTDSKLDFTFDDPVTNFLYMHGVIDKESGVGDERYIRFSCPFVQKRLFNYFSRELNRNVGELYHPMTDLTPVVMGAKLDIANLVGLYRDYLENNRSWLFKDAPRRSDMKIREAVFHFNFYAYLNEFLKRFGGNVYPEFPTGNGQVDIIIRYKGECYALEVKSFSGAFQYREGLKQSARYAHKLGLPVIYLLFFIESIDDANRSQYETPYHDKSLKVQVKPIFIETGNSGERKG